MVAAFLSLAAVVLSVGLLGAAGMGLYAHEHMSDSVGRSIAIGAAIALSGVMLASMLAFFGYVLKLLNEIAEDTRGQIQGIKGTLRSLGASRPTVPDVAARASVSSMTEVGVGRSRPKHAASTTIPEGLRDELRTWLSW